MQKVGFSENAATNMILKRSSNLFGYYGLAYELGRISLKFFCMYFLQDTYLPKETNAASPITHVHREILSDIEHSIISYGLNQIGRIFSRCTGKSAFGTYADEQWCYAYAINKYTIICSDIGSYGMTNIYKTNFRLDGQ